MLTWTKTESGYTAAAAHGTYQISRTPGHRFAVAFAGVPLPNAPAGTLAAVKKHADTHAAAFAAAPGPTHVPCPPDPDIPAPGSPTDPLPGPAEYPERTEPLPPLPPPAGLPDDPDTDPDLAHVGHEHADPPGEPVGETAGGPLVRVRPVRADGAPVLSWLEF